MRKRQKLNYNKTNDTDKDINYLLIVMKNYYHINKYKTNQNTKYEKCLLNNNVSLS